MLSYLYGSIPFGYIATYIIKGKKLTEEGTGNVGVTNTFKVGGTGAGIVTILGEISKAGEAKAALPLSGAYSCSRATHALFYWAPGLSWRFLPESAFI